MRRFFLIAIIQCCGIVFCFSQAAQAGVTAVQAMNFGEFLSYNNDAQYEITVNTNGSYSYDSAGFVEILPPQEGIYDIDGLPANVAITSVFVTQNAALTASGGSFEMVDFQETHPSNVDGDGVARITIGATARASGTGTAYPDRTYSGVVNIQINY